MRAAEQLMGFMPADGLTMAHAPDLLEPVLELVQAVYNKGTVDRRLKQMVGLMSSAAAGCKYCKGHTYYGGLNQGIPVEKLDAIWQYDTSGLFKPHERVALRVAHLASLTPNQASDEDMAELRCHFSDGEIAEIVAVIAMFGFLNRWNDTIKTDLEAQPGGALAESGLQ